MIWTLFQIMSLNFHNNVRFRLKMSDLKKIAHQWTTVYRNLFLNNLQRAC
jgi:hypothetical protein